MKLCGMSQQAIADKLNADEILALFQYKKSIGVRLNSSFAKSMKLKWSYNYRQYGFQIISWRS